MLWDVLGCAKFDVVLNVSIVVLFFYLFGSCALCLRCLKLFYIFLCCGRLCCFCFKLSTLFSLSRLRGRLLLVV